MAARADQRSALITGVAGQDGSFLAELLLERGYRVTGTVRPGRREHWQGSPAVKLVELDLLDSPDLRAIVADSRPSELYHLAGPSYVPEVWRSPAEGIASIAGATAVLLEAVREFTPQSRVFLASTGTIFGGASESPQSESTCYRPATPYATAKLAAHQLGQQLRRHDNLFVCCGILYNHESERRPTHFVTRKISRGAAAIKLGLAHHLPLGDLNAVRDWSFAGDVMHGAWLMLQHQVPDDYVLASGAGHKVREFAELAFGHLGLDPSQYLRTDPSLVRPVEEVPLVGDPSLAHERLGWRPSMSFEDLVMRMVDADLRDLRSRLEAAPNAS